MTYRKEDEEKPARVIHEWHILPKFDEAMLWRSLFVVAFALGGMGLYTIGCLIYDWRLAESDKTKPVTFCGVEDSRTANSKFSVVIRRGRHTTVVGEAFPDPNTAASARILLCPKETP